MVMLSPYTTCSVGERGNKLLTNYEQIKSPGKPGSFCIVTIQIAHKSYLCSLPSPLGPAALRRVSVFARPLHRVPAKRPKGGCGNSDDMAVAVGERLKRVAAPAARYFHDGSWSRV